MGRRVSIRRRVGRDAGGRAVASDVVGDLLVLDSGRAVVQTRAGLVEIALDDVQLARIAPPSTADELALEAIAAAGWLPEQTGAVGGWVLRASGGFSLRGNSVLPLRSPGRPLADALALAHDWYAERGLPLQLHVPTEARRLLDAELGERGWPIVDEVQVLVARLDGVGPHPAGFPANQDSEIDTEVRAEVSAQPDEQWLARYRDGSALSPAARALLTRHERVGFAAVREPDGAVVAIGRGVVDEGWLGVAAVEVDPAQRRSGLASAVMAALWRWGAARGAVRSYLQVHPDNHAALALYARLGYWHHHDYRYRREP